jgi:hypothetical protein
MANSLNRPNGTRDRLEEMTVNRRITAFQNDLADAELCSARERTGP